MNMIPRCRMLYSKIWSSNQVTELKPIEVMLYIGMISLGDDEGKLKGNPRYLRSQIFPYWSVSPEKTQKMIDRIVEVGLIELYSDENGIYIAHPNWYKYQKLRRDRANISEFPDFLSDKCQIDDGHVSAEDKVIEEKLNEDNINKVKPTSAREKMMSGMQGGGEKTMFNRKRAQSDALTINLEDMPL
jgi:hypothetical protein